MSPNEHKRIEKQDNPDSFRPDKEKFEISFFESAGDEDFNAIFPRLKSAEKRYLNKKARRSFTKSKLTILLIVAAILIVVLGFVLAAISFD